MKASTFAYFKDKVIWITGASSGIGLALVQQLAEVPCHIILSARNAEALTRAASGAHKAKFHIVTLDLSNPTSMIASCEEALHWKGRVDVLFNNGGISQRSEAIHTHDAILRQIMEVNFFANVHLAQAVLPGMIARGMGHIVVTSSLMGKWGFYLRSAYGASKHALHGYYDSLRMEVEAHGVHVTLLTPGFIATEISKHALTGEGRPSGEMDQNQAKGMSAESCAVRILEGVAQGKKELAIGGGELRGLWVKRFFPGLFERILRRQKAR
jgi:dehydrogenase/reductase SDR family member 7B